MPALPLSYFTESFQHLYALLSQDNGQPPPAVILDEVKEKLVDEKKSFPGPNSSSRNTINSAPESELPKNAKEFILKWSDFMKLDELHCRKMLATYMEYDARVRAADFQYSAEDGPKFVEWCYEERIARISCMTSLLKLFPDLETSKWLLGNNLHQVIIRTFETLSNQLKNLLAAKGPVTPVEMLQVTQLLLESAAVLDLWLVFYIVQPEEHCNSLETLVTVVKTFQESSHLHGATMQLSRIAVQAIQRIGCLSMLVVLAVLAPSNGSRAWDTTSLSANGMQWDDLDDVLKWLVATLSKPPPTAPAGAPPLTHWGPIHLAASCLTSDTAKGIELRMQCANHVWQVKALPYLLTVLDSDGRYLLWEGPPANSVAYHLMVADLMAACIGAWGWLGTDVALTRQVVAVIAALQVPPRQPYATEGGPWGSLLTHLEQFFPLKPEAALYCRLLAAGCQSRCVSIGYLLSRLRQLPSCAVMPSPSQVHFLDLSEPEEHAAPLRLPYPLQASDGLTIPVHTPYFALSRLFGTTEHIVVCQYRLPVLRLLIHRVGILCASEPDTNASEEILELTVAVLELLDACLAYEPLASNGGSSEGAASMRIQLFNEFDSACLEVHQVGLVAFLYTVARRLSHWVCPLHDCQMKLDASAMVWRCIQRAAALFENDEQRLMEIYGNLAVMCEHRSAMTAITQPRGEASLRQYNPTLIVLELAHESCRRHCTEAVIHFIVDLLTAHVVWSYNSALQRWSIAQWCLRTVLTVIVDGTLTTAPETLVQLYHSGASNQHGCGLLSTMLDDPACFRVLFIILGYGAVALQRTGVAHQGEVATAVQACVLMALHCIALLLHSLARDRRGGQQTVETPFETALLNWMISAVGQQQIPLITLIFGLMSYPKSMLICVAATDAIALIAQTRATAPDGSTRAPALLGYLCDKNCKDKAHMFASECIERLRKDEDGNEPRISLLKLIGSLLTSKSSLATYFMGSPPKLGALPATTEATGQDASHDFLTNIFEFIKPGSTSHEDLKLVSMALDIILMCWHTPEHRVALFKASKNQVSFGGVGLWKQLQRIICDVLEVTEDQTRAAYQWRCATTCLTLFAMEYYHYISMPQPGGQSGAADATAMSEGDKSFSDGLVLLTKNLRELLRKALAPSALSSADGAILAAKVQATTSALFSKLMAINAVDTSHGILHAMADFQNDIAGNQAPYGPSYFYNVPKLLTQLQKCPSEQLEAINESAQQLNTCLSLVDASVTFLSAFQMFTSVMLKPPQPVVEGEGAKETKKPETLITLHVDQLNDLIGVLLQSCLLTQVPATSFADGSGTFVKVFDGQLREVNAAMLMELLEGCIDAVKAKDEDSDRLKSHAPKVLTALQSLQSAGASPKAQRDLIVALTLLLDFYWTKSPFPSLYADFYVLLPAYLTDSVSECYQAALCTASLFGAPQTSRSNALAAMHTIIQQLLTAIVQYNGQAHAESERQLQRAAQQHGAASATETLPSTISKEQQYKEESTILLQLQTLVRLASSHDALRCFNACSLIPQLTKMQPEYYLAQGIRHPEVTRSTLKQGGTLEQRHWHHIWCLHLTIVSQTLVTLAREAQQEKRVPSASSDDNSLLDTCVAFVHAHQSTIMEVLQGTYISFPGFSANDLQECDLCLSIVQSLCTLNRPLLWLLPLIKRGLRTATNVFSWQSGFKFSSLGISAPDNATAASSQSRSRSRSSQRADSVTSYDKGRYRPSQAEEVMVFRILRGFLSVLRSFMSWAIRNTYEGTGTAPPSLGGPIVTFGAAPPADSLIRCMVLDLTTETVAFQPYGRRWGQVAGRDPQQSIVPLTICVDLMNGCAGRLKVMFTPSGSSGRRSISLMRSSTTPSHQSLGPRDRRLLSQILHVLEEAAVLVMLHLVVLRNVNYSALPREQQSALEQLQGALKGLLNTLEQHLQSFENEVENLGEFVEIDLIESAKKVIKLLAECTAEISLPGGTELGDHTKKPMYRRASQAGQALMQARWGPAA